MQNRMRIGEKPLMIAVSLRLPPDAKIFEVMEACRVLGLTPSADPRNGNQWIQLFPKQEEIEDE